ncbi:biotin/lipoyl-containing protein, partial [Nesterenkonia sp. F]|uniref:biotin/lipoyl-containing protein n=1 Tax=Nesterenkonia sp. F TaxID=795955 RepID=UPI000255C871
MTTFDLPDLGEGLTEATLLTWLVSEGDTIVVDQPVAEVETAKSTLEVPSPFAGTVTRLHGAEGDTMVVERPLISVDTGDGATGPDAAAEPSAAQAPTAQAPTAQTAGALDHREEERAGAAVPGDPDSAPAQETADEGSGNVLIGYGTSESSGARRRRRRRAAASPAASAPPEATTSPGA